MANGGSTLTPEQMLALAQKQMALLLAGKAPSAIDTPQLGRVEFFPTDIGQLQQLINSLQMQVDPTSAWRYRRRPLSLEAWP